MHTLNIHYIGIDNENICVLKYFVFIVLITIIKQGELMIYFNLNPLCENRASAILCIDLEN